MARQGAFQGIGGDGVNVAGDSNSITNIKNVNNDNRRGGGGGNSNRSSNSGQSASGAFIVCLFSSVLLVRWFAPRAVEVLFDVQIASYVSLVAIVIECGVRVFAPRVSYGSLLQSASLFTLWLAAWSLLELSASMIQPWYPEFATVTVKTLFGSYKDAALWIIRNAEGTTFIALFHLLIGFRLINTLIGRVTDEDNALARRTDHAAGWSGVAICGTMAVGSAIFLQHPLAVEAVNYVKEAFGF